MNVLRIVDDENRCLAKPYQTAICLPGINAGAIDALAIDAVAIDVGAIDAGAINN